MSLADPYNAAAIEPPRTAELDRRTRSSRHPGSGTVWDGEELRGAAVAGTAALAYALW